jgi:hypothetical protein
MDDELYTQTKMIMKTELKWAIVYVVMTMAWSLLGKSLGFHDSRIATGVIFNTLIIIPSVIIYVLSMREKKLNYFGGQVSYKQTFMSGLILTLFVTILGPIYPIFTNMISPDLFDKSIRFMVTSNQMSEADAVKQFTLLSFIIQGIFGSIIFGLIYSAVIAIFLKSKKSRSLTHD